MTEHEKCPKCGSKKLVRDVRIVDLTIQENLLVQVQTKPQAKLFKGTVSTPVKAQVCGECGYTELYASEPEKLIEAQKVADKG